MREVRGVRDVREVREVRLPSFVPSRLPLMLFFCSCRPTTWHLPGAIVEGPGAQPSGNTRSWVPSASDASSAS